MASEVGSAFVSIIPSARGFGAKLGKEIDAPATKAGDSAGKKSGGRFRSGFVSSLRGMAAPIAAAIGGVALVGLLTGSVTAASDLGETVSKTSQIFGKEALPALQDFAKGAAKSLGQSQQGALDAVATFGVFGKSAGLQGPKLAGFSTKLTSLATDMASFGNTSPEEAVEAIGAALRGESEPIRKYGVLLDDATLRQEALRLGLVKTTKQALTPQQRVLAAQAAIFKQTSDQQGDFARTSGGLANQQRILSAQFQNTKVKIGNVLLPVVTRMVTAFNDRLFPALKKIGEGIRIFFQAFSGGSELGEFDGKLRAVNNAGVTLGALFRDQIVPAVKSFGSFVMGTVVPALVSMAGFVKRNADFFVPLVAALGTAIVVVKVITTVTRLWAAAQAVLNAVILANPVGIIIVLVAALVAGIVVAYKRSETFRRIVDGALRGVATAAKFMWGVIKPVFLLWFNTWRRIITTAIQVGAAVGRFVGQVIGFFGRLQSGVASRIGRLISFVRGIPGRIKGALSNLGSLLYNAGVNVVQGLIDGIKAKAGAVVGVVKDIAGSIRDHFPFSPAKRGPLKLFPMDKAGRNIGEGLAIGLTSSQARVAKAAGTLAQKVTDAIKRQLPRIRARLAEVVSASRDMAKSVADSVRGTFDISSARGGAGGMIESLTAQIAKAKEFAAALRTLKKKGLSTGLLTQLAQAGPTSGAAELAAASKAEIAKINAQVRQLSTLGNQTGAFVADANFAATQRSLERQERLFERYLKSRQVMHLYDSDGKLMGTVRAVVKQENKKQARAVKSGAR